MLRSEDGLVGIYVTQQLLPSPMVSAGFKGEEVGCAIYIEHMIELCALEGTPSAIDGSQGGQTVEGDLSGTDTDHFAIFEMQLVNCMNRACLPSIKSESEASDGVQLRPWYLAQCRVRPKVRKGI